MKDLGVKVFGLVLPAGLEVDEAEISGRDVSVTQEPFGVSAGDGSTVQVRVSCRSIERFLHGLDLPNLSDIRVSAVDGHIQVSAVARVIVPIAATALCAVESADGKRLTIRLETAEPAAAKALIDRQLAQINPVLDLSSFPVPLTVKKVEVKGDSVVLSGVIG